MKKTTTAVVATLAALALAGSAFATAPIQTEYKKEKKVATANCQTCHTAKMPSKKDNTTELADFGKKVAAAKGKDGKIDWTKVEAPAPAPAEKK